MSVPEKIRYGAAELKEFYNRNLALALGISVGFHLVLIGLYLFGTNIGKSAPKGPPVSAKMKLVTLAPPAEDVAPPPPPPPIIPPQLQSSGSGTGGVATRAGNPVAVPDALIAPDVKEFASTKEISVAVPQGGDGTGFGGLEGNGLGAQIPVSEVKVDKKEEDPAPDAFLPDATEPGFDLADIQKRVVYPELARKNGIEGRVTIRVLVGKTGKPEKYLVDQSDNKLLEKAAADAVMSTAFSPGVQNGTPVKVWVSIPVIFKIN